jgi:hypothetical protein
MFLEMFDQPVAFVHERSLVSPLTVNARPGGVDVTASTAGRSHFRAVALIPVGTEVQGALDGRDNRH